MSEPDQRSNLSARRELFGVGLILFFFLFVNLLVATQTPTVHFDETVFADPPANLYFGSGFTSTMWAEDRHEMFSSQPPLYFGLLYVFFKGLGFGLFQARFANSIIAAAASLLIWAGLRRSRLVESPGFRLLTLALILSGSCSTLTFRMIRYDVGMFLVSSLVFFACCLPAHLRGRYLWVVLSSIWCPFAGVPMLPYVTLVLFLLLVVYRFQILGLVLSVAAGFTLGVGLLFLFYHHFGVLSHFLGFVHSATHVSDPALYPRPSLKTIIFGESLGEESLLTSFFGNPLSIYSMKTMFDYSAFLLFLLFLLFSAKIWRATNGPVHKLIIFILLTTLVIPPVIQYSGHYWSDYRWMTYIPLTIAVPRLLELARGLLRTSPGLRLTVFAVIGLSLLLGMPARTLVVVKDWPARSVTPINRVAARVVQPSDVVVCSYKVYFAVRPHAQLVYCTSLTAMGEFRYIKDLPTNQISLLALFPSNVVDTVKVIGGKWKKLPLDEIPDAAALSKTRYAIDFYRRDANSIP